MSKFGIILLKISKCFNILPYPGYASFTSQPTGAPTERVTVKLLPDLTDKQRSTNNHTAVVSIEYDVEPTKINFTEPVSVASKNLGKIDLPIVCVAKNRPKNAKITVSWHRRRFL